MALQDLAVLSEVYHIMINIYIYIGIILSLSLIISLSLSLSLSHICIYYPCRSGERKQMEIKDSWKKKKGRCMHAWRRLI